MDQLSQQRCGRGSSFTDVSARPDKTSLLAPLEKDFDGNPPGSPNCILSFLDDKTSLLAHLRISLLCPHLNLCLNFFCG